MKLVLLSDLHEHLPDLSKLDYDGVIIAGDLSFRPYMDLQGEVDFYLGRFYPWVKSLKKDVFCIYGNHDHAGELTEVRRRGPDNIRVDYWGVNKMFGLYINALSFTLPFQSWAFQADERRLNAMLEYMGKSDILVTHGPPFNTLDEHECKNIGSKAVLQYIFKHQPKLVVCGHCHTRGFEWVGDTLVVNASYVGNEYQPLNKVFIYDTETKDVIETSVTTLSR